MASRYCRVANSRRRLSARERTPPLRVRQVFAVTAGSPASAAQSRAAPAMSRAAKRRSPGAPFATSGIGPSATGGRQGAHGGGPERLQARLVFLVERGDLERVERACRSGQAREIQRAAGRAPCRRSPDAALATTAPRSARRLVRRPGLRIAGVERQRTRCRRAGSGESLARGRCTRAARLCARRMLGSHGSSATCASAMTAMPSPISSICSRGFERLGPAVQARNQVGDGDVEQARRGDREHDGQRLLHVGEREVAGERADQRGNADGDVERKCARPRVNPECSEHGEVADLLRHRMRDDRDGRGDAQAVLARNAAAMTMPSQKLWTLVADQDHEPGAAPGRAPCACSACSCSDSSAESSCARRGRARAARARAFPAGRTRAGRRAR